MPDFLFVLLHWGHDPERLQNTLIAWHSLQRLVKHLGTRGHLAEACLYDFSAERPLTESIHLPFPDGVYEKSAKINSVLRSHVSDAPRYIVFLDGDIIVPQEDWDAFDMSLRFMNPAEFQLFRTRYSRPPLPILPGTYYLDESKLDAPHENAPTCGRMFIAPFRVLTEIGGFDERFKVWGAEDHDVQQRLTRFGLTPIVAPAMFIVHLYHTPHKLPYDHPEYRRQWMYFKGDSTIVRNGGPLDKNTRLEKTAVSPNGGTLT